MLVRSGTVTRPYVYGVCACLYPPTVTQGLNRSHPRVPRWRVRHVAVPCSFRDKNLTVRRFRLRALLTCLSPGNHWTDLVRNKVRGRFPPFVSVV